MEPRGDIGSILTEVYGQFQAYNSIDLLTTIAALQLCPENADHTIRLEALSHIATCLTFVTDKTNISRHRLNRICNSAPFGDGYLRSIEDPCDNPFTEAFTFFGGSYIVFPGISEDITFSLRHLTSAIFLNSTFKQHKDFMNKVHKLVLTILILSDEIARQANLSRNLEPISQSRDVFIPHNLEDKKKAVLFTEDDLAGLLLPYELGIKDIEVFTQTLGELALNSYTPETTPLHTKPIIHIENQFIVLEPGILLASLRFQILTEAKRTNLIKLLSVEYQRSVAHTVTNSMSMFGVLQVDEELCERDEKLFLRDSLWTLDTDKALYLALITDDFSDFVGEAVFEKMPEKNSGELFDNYFLQVEETIHSKSHGLSEFFAIILFAGVGRTAVISSKLDGLKSNPAIISLTVEELEILSLLNIKNPFVLYKFARDIEDLQKTTHFIAFSTLDIFEIYRKHDFSFYLTDDRKPNFITFSPGSERELRLEVLRKHDKHAVPYYKGGYSEAYRLYGSADVPIYVPVNLSRKGDWFVELTPLSFWVIYNDEVDQANVTPNSVNPAHFVDMITYWLWQFSPDLERHLSEIDFLKPLVLQVEIAQNEDWKSVDGEFLLRTYPNIVDYKLNIEDFQITLEFHPSILEALLGATNSGELRFMGELLMKVVELLELVYVENFPEKLSLNVPDILSKHLANPVKKKFLVLPSNNNVQMMPGNYFSFREIQGSDRSHVLDETGKFCSNKLKISEGLIPANNVVNVLNQVVNFCFSELESIIRTLPSDYLLEFLIAQYEAIVAEKASRQLTLTTQLACFSNAEDVTQQLIEDMPKLNEAAISCRFLIEYVATISPTGTEPISFTVYDRLMALASEIISRGRESDYANYQLFNIQLSMLPSGRLGFDNQKAFGDLQLSYMISRSREEIDDASRFFDVWWHTQSSEDAGKLSEDAQEFNQAFYNEFGFTLKDLSVLISNVGDLSIELNDGRQLKKIRKDDLISKLAEVTQWNVNKVEMILDFLALRPRKEFLSVSSEYSKSDVFPWRLSRGLSYMRRPLLMTEEQGQTYICWGVRHLFDSFEYILRSSRSGQLQPRYSSTSMQKWLGSKHKKDGIEFNAKVADSVKILPNTIVRSQVKKFGSTRLSSTGNELGDIDVLLIMPTIKTITLIECKNLLIARTPSEMKRELDELFVDAATHTSTVTKHKRREKWVRDNLEHVLSVYGFDIRGQWKVSSLLVVSDELITPYFYKPLIPVISFLRFVEDYLPDLQNKLKRKHKK